MGDFCLTNAKQDLESAKRASKTYIMAGTWDPTVDNTAAYKGTLFLRVGALGGSQFIKNDDGCNTNWSKVGAVGVDITQASSNVIFVDGARTDTYVENGSVLTPFKTIQAAINQVIANGDNAIDTKPYTIMVAAGAYPENLTLNDAALVDLTFMAIEPVLINPAAGDSLNCTANNANFARLDILGRFTFGRTVQLIGDTDGGSTFGNDQNFVDCIFAMKVTAKNLIVFDMIRCKLNADCEMENILIGILSSGEGQGPFQLDVNENLVNPKPAGFAHTVFIIEKTLTLANLVNIQAGATLQLREGVRFQHEGATVNIDGTLDAYASWMRSGTVNINAGGTLKTKGTSIQPAAVVNLVGTWTNDNSLSNWRVPVTSQIGAYVAKVTDEVILSDVNAAPANVTLFDPAKVPGKRFTVKKTDGSANASTVVPAAGLIDGAANYPLAAQYNFVTVVSDGANYHIIAKG